MSIYPTIYLFHYLSIPLSIYLLKAKEIVTIRLEADTGFDVEYGKLYSYLASRNRFAVVGSCNKKTVKVIFCWVVKLLQGPLFLEFYLVLK